LLQRSKAILAITFCPLAPHLTRQFNTRMTRQPQASAKSVSAVEIQVEAITLCPYAFDHVDATDTKDVQIGVGIAGIVARDCGAFTRGDEVWSRMPVSLSPDVKRVKLAARNVFKLAPGITLEQAATLGDSGLMALHAVQVAGIETGARLLIHGAANPFGSAAIALAAHLGANVIATVDLPHEQRVAAAAGAAHVGLARSREALPNLRKWLGTQGATAILDGAFLENAALNLELLAPGSCIVTCLMKGKVTAETQFAFSRTVADFNRKKVDVKFVSGVDLDNADLVDIPRMAGVLGEALASRRYQPVVGQVLSPDELVDAMAMLNHGRMVGSLVLKPGTHPT
jgi:NADPH:quinone reductase-like Zn-dependent oxidoreductase